MLTSCATLKSDKFVDGQIELTKENLNLLNGNYSRIPVNQSEKREGDLFWNFTNRGYNVGADSLCSVKIRVVNENRLDITLLKNDSIIKSKVVKGKLKNGYFEIKRRVFLSLQSISMYLERLNLD